MNQLAWEVSHKQKMAYKLMGQGYGMGRVAQMNLKRNNVDFVWEGSQKLDRRTHDRFPMKIKHVTLEGSHETEK